MLALIDRTPLPTPDFHRTSAAWRKAILKWSKMVEWNECPELLLRRLPNMISELELFEKELADWEKIIQQYQDRDRDNSRKSAGEDHTAETVMKLRYIPPRTNAAKRVTLRKAYLKTCVTERGFRIMRCYTE